MTVSEGNTQNGGPTIAPPYDQGPPQWAFLSLVLGACCIGLAPVFMRLSDVGTSAAAFWRGGLSLPVLVLIFLVQVRRGRETAFSWGDIKAASAVGFFFALDLYFWHWSVDATTVANATLLANLASVFTALFAYFIWRTPITRAFWGALGVTIAGAVILVGVNAEVRPDYLFGDFLGLVTAIAYAAYILSVARVRQSMSTLKVMVGTTIGLSAFLAGPMILEEAPMIPPTLDGWTALLVLALVSHVMGQGLIAYGLMAVPPALGSLTLLIQPVVAAIAAWILFAEALGPLQGVGAGMVLLGVALAKRSG